MLFIWATPINDNQGISSSTAAGNHQTHVPTPKSNKLKDRIEELLISGKGADGYFLIKEEEHEKQARFKHKKQLFRVHKSILSAASTVFKTVFNGDQTKTPLTAGSGKPLTIVSKIVPGGACRHDNNNPIVVTDVNIFAFNTLLRYIYTDDLDELELPNLFSVFYAAKKYKVLGLYLRCFDQMDKRAIKIFRSFNFLSINQELLCDLLERDQLVINEIEIWNAALRWADNQCHKNGKEITGANRREMLGPALFKIRFPTISHEDFSRIIVPSAVLIEDELINAYKYYSLPRENVPIFPTKFRALSSCKLILEIKNFSEFEKSTKSYDHHISHPFFPQGLELVIRANIMESFDEFVKTYVYYLGFFLKTDQSTGSTGKE
ncbi:hypothetical protein niasHT_012166 [Heterodera trifolii]|uniref:BTB domain-containing protein n=1 Tax=Heterodera trifolii TaxID=157864 RepID=A0ABD2KTZ6_9BILA